MIGPMKTLLSGALFAAALSFTSCSTAPPAATPTPMKHIQKTAFGQTAANLAVDLYTITNPDGASVAITFRLGSSDSTFVGNITLSKEAAQKMAEVILKPPDSPGPMFGTVIEIDERPPWELYGRDQALAVEVVVAAMLGMLTGHLSASIA